MGCRHVNPTNEIYNPVGLRFLMHLRFSLSYLNEHKLRHNFTDCVNLLCYSNIKPETTLHFFSALSQLLQH